MVPQGFFDDLLPEIYPLIAAHLPLYAAPSKLLALALTNQSISEFALPLLYSRLVLKNETNALHVLQRLLNDPPFGRVVRELHITSELSYEIRTKDPPSDVIRRVEEVISSGCLPLIHTLDLYVTQGWYHDPQRALEPVRGFGMFSKAFSMKLKLNCPRLRCLMLENFAEYSDDTWIEESGIVQVSDITSLAIRFQDLTLEASVTNKLFKHIRFLSASLNALELGPGYVDSTSTSPIFELDLPVLRSLTLSTFTETDTMQSMAFFERHPSIEYLNIASNLMDDGTCWFTPELPHGFLPNLSHLRAQWQDVRPLVPLLPQLLTLSIYRSINTQIPYLLRALLPRPLLRLRSLGIGQVASSSNRNKHIEGGLWFERVDGTFHQARRRESQSIFDSFMHSIARATPNLEELAFHGSCFPLGSFHLYHQGIEYNPKSRIDQATFASYARELADVVPGLESITNVAKLYPPYLTARITRNTDGKIADVEMGKGYGMKVGYDDEAFPWAPREASG
ncbi:hypothetical protein CPB84DRAFT_1794599 [Gymnopilus junonius]|uniref:Uncharacterized protein n=1 Tax=Gymnopilus junonius TaxID=109634 RepID=A0A9P5NCB8_GYMJU|nr:hypothetical protein CPB84DRAFT_1794599 [Gymnopilus junonius]